MPDLSIMVNNLVIQFGDFFAVNNISFDVRKGEIFGLLGANGAGKTTTIRALLGIIIPTSGRLNIAGVESSKQTSEAIKRQVGYMSQKLTIYDDLTVAENLQLIAGLRKLNHKQFKERSEKILNMISFNQSQKTLVKELPSGVKQQVSLAASAMHDPAIIFLDEPTAGVSPLAREKFWQLIHHFAKEGKTILVTTHYMDEAEKCERIALMRAGEIIALDTPKNLKQKIFPYGIFELKPKDANLTQVLADKWSTLSDIFDLKAYGLRFHAFIHNWERFKLLDHELKKDFEVENINPSFEDVFIELVEGQNR
ncbi:MAG: hypothetical protein A2381_05730 [Bdellovibrionales bacterium RIFOXYB1_FULL_37_110]|nr:MAG: hypothetical protein A2417_06345 [Bdellovibrionales bacterium RIFOXYC1_FULL_37_79]OFZ58551.1 MAG: hypothetical protein A2381_05730 [Bdellovibrionales bacterium RIFOXYB1_FULL_37_110]OFZ63771.1 MAG: hypothetical protein A2577_07480 [Bdellovibrionales bacterium RIFOXYD1_FULL_36_51]